MRREVIEINAMQFRLVQSKAQRDDMKFLGFVDWRYLDCIPAGPKTDWLKINDRPYFLIGCGVKPPLFSGS
jgi:hypothetical protein